MYGFVFFGLKREISNFFVHFHEKDPSTKRDAMPERCRRLFHDEESPGTHGPATLARYLQPGALDGAHCVRRRAVPRTPGNQQENCAASARDSRARVDWLAGETKRQPHHTHFRL